MGILAPNREDRVVQASPWLAIGYDLGQVRAECGLFEGVTIEERVKRMNLVKVNCRDAYVSRFELQRMQGRERILIIYV